FTKTAKVLAWIEIDAYRPGRPVGRKRTAEALWRHGARCCLACRRACRARTRSIPIRQWRLAHARQAARGWASRATSRRPQIRSRYRVNGICGGGGEEGERV